MKGEAVAWAVVFGLCFVFWLYQTRPCQDSVHQVSALVSSHYCHPEARLQIEADANGDPKRILCACPSEEP